MMSPDEETEENVLTQESSANKRIFASRRPLRWVLGLITVLIISLLFPQNLKFPFNFDLGQTWRYADLRAPYSIPILKTDEELELEREKVESDDSPVYQVDLSVARNARASFLEDFRVQLDSARSSSSNVDLLRQPEQHRRYGLEVLDRIYSRGIINARSEDEVNGMGTLITVINGNEIQRKTLSQFFTPGDARDWLVDSLFYTSLKSPEFLLDILDDKLHHNVFYSDSLTEARRRMRLNNIVPYNGLINEGDFIIRQGDMVDNNIYQKLVSYRKIYNKNLSRQTTFWSVFGGFAVQVGLVIFLTFLYVRSFFTRIYDSIKHLVFIFLWFVLYALIVRTVDLSPELNPYIVPFCIVPIIIRIFYNERLAFFVHVCVVLIASFLTTQGYSYTFLNLMAGVVVIVMDVDTRDWGRYFRSLLLLFGFYCVGYIGLELQRGGNWTTVDYSVLGWLGCNAFLVLLAYPLIPLLERLFGLISPITLVELSDMNRPLLERLAREAPGTWQHSLNVANMSEQAARAIGANALLVKTAALYHDIGKIKRPTFFIENQTGPNPHEKIDDLASARIIIEHVTEGIEMARKAGLPKVIIDFIRTHHGTTRTEYFYRNYIKDHPEREVNEAKFRYPGPKPVTREQTILMLADSTEAASKSLKNPTEEELFQLIDNVISGKLNSGQLSDSHLTFQQFETCRDVFRSILKSAHHVRVVYPDKVKNKEEE